eukprot:1039484-Prymnesium_polylepis.1
MRRTRQNSQVRRRTPREHSTRTGSGDGSTRGGADVPARGGEEAFSPHPPSPPPPSPPPARFGVR